MNKTGYGRLSCPACNFTLKYPRLAQPQAVVEMPEVVACHLVSVDPSSYGVELSAEQTTRLRRIFPDGVCDWGRTGRGQKVPTRTWQVFDQP